MARWATFCEIGGVSFTGCRVELVDAEPFLTTNSGSVDWANDGTPHIQTVNRGVKGIQFGMRMVSAEQTKLQSVFDAIETGEGTQVGIVVHVTDGLFDVNVVAVADYSQKWFSFGKHSEGWYEDIMLRFISVSAAP